jgi:hypothetical protein
MKLTLLICTVFGLAACGGGGGEVASSSGVSPVAAAPVVPGVPMEPPKPVKPFADYTPAYLSIFAGSYAASCGPTSKPRIATVIKISTDGIVTPWLGGSLNLQLGTLAFTRRLKDIPEDGFVGGVSGGEYQKPDISFSIGSAGRIVGYDFSLGNLPGNILNDGNPLNVSRSVNILSCDDAAEAAALANKSAYTAFAKFIDTPKKNLSCFRPNSTTVFPESYEIAAGQLQFRGKAISLLTGIKAESILDYGFAVSTDPSGKKEYVRFPTYNIRKLDGTEIGLIFNEYGEMTSLLSQPGTSDQITCVQPL